jgi:hypothetical protein
VILAAVFIFRDGDLHPGVFSVDLGLQAAEDVDRGVAELLVDPWVAVAGVGVRGIPQVTRALHDELDLSVGEGCAGQIENARAVRVVVFRVPMKVVDVDQGLAVRGGRRLSRLQIFIREPVCAAGCGGEFPLPVVDSLKAVVDGPKDDGVRELVFDGLRECDRFGDVVV